MRSARLALAALLLVMIAGCRTLTGAAAGKPGWVGQPAGSDQSSKFLSAVGRVFASRPLARR